MATNIYYGSCKIQILLIPQKQHEEEETETETVVRNWESLVNEYDTHKHT